MNNKRTVGNWISAHDAALLGLGGSGLKRTMELLKGRKAGVGDVPVHELADPRMTDLGVIRDALPVAAPRLQQFTDLGVEGFHKPILVKNSSESKQHFTNALPHPRRVTEKRLPINDVVAQNLAYWMAQAGGMSQSTLAERAGVSQKTISNYLNPGQRVEGASGKPPSAKLAELDAIAKALAVEVWQLTRQMSKSERLMYSAIEKAYADLRASVVAGGEDEPAQPPADELPDGHEYPSPSTDELKRRMLQRDSEARAGNESGLQPGRAPGKRGGRRA